MDDRFPSGRHPQGDEMNRSSTGLDRFLTAIALVSAWTAGVAHAQTCSPTLFIEAVAYPAGGFAKAVAVADFNGDAKPDVATANTNSRSVSVLINDGTGGL